MANLSSGTITGLNNTVSISNFSNIATGSVIITGTWTGILSFEISADNVTFYPIYGKNQNTGTLASSSNSNSTFVFNLSGFNYFRIKMTAYMSGTANIEIWGDAVLNAGNFRTYLKGNSDGTHIGNVGDRLKVDSSFSSAPRISPSYIGTKVKFDDMNASNGGVARDTAINSTTVYTQLYSYTGNGHLFAFTVSFEGNLIGADPFDIKLEIDGTTCFEVDTLDIGTSTFWNLTNVGDEGTMGLSLNSNTFRFSQKHGGLRYESSLKIYIKKGAGGSKRFRGGMVYLTKE